ncbi:MAG: type II secretion system F family protein [Oscillospiraceae bacterium]|nr:type II secretion system F family protein [Oscillospiraceae bacterium]
MKYTYFAVQENGKRTKGEISAENEASALQKLRELKLVPTELSQAKINLGADGSEAKSIFTAELFEKDIHKQKFPRKKMIMVFNQLSIMLKAGVTLSMAIEVMMENEKNARLRHLFRELHVDMMNGVALSASMEKFAAFDCVAVNIVRAGEADGRLERSFAQIARNIEKQNTLIGKVQSAAIYPCILLVLVIIVLIIINIVVMPTFVEMFASMGQDLPAFTTSVLNISKFFSRFWYLIFVAVFGLVALYIALRRTSLRFAILVDRAVLHIPVAGALVLHSQTARFARILSTLLEAGQDFLSALGIAQSVLSNQFMIAGLTQISEEVRMGNPISTAMAKHKFFAPVFISMVRAGEESGNLSETLSKMADMYETQTDESAKRVTTMMEPLMTVVIAVVVGAVVIAIAMPMFGMFNLVGNV